MPEIKPENHSYTITQNGASLTTEDTKNIKYDITR